MLDFLFGEKVVRTTRTIEIVTNKFICSECGTKYSSPETTPPPGIKWNDGHICTPKPVNKDDYAKRIRD
jgi:hypothetical protein